MNWRLQVMKKKQIEDIYPLSPLQRGMLFEALAGSDGGHLLQWDVTVELALTAELLGRTWGRLLERHSILRSEFYWEGLKEFLQVVKKSEFVSLNVDEIDWSDVGAAEIDTRFTALADRRRREGFDPRNAPLIQLDLVHLGPQRSRFLATIDHLVVDGWSLGVLGEELLEILRAEREGGEPHLVEPRPFREYVNWLRKQSDAEQERFWATELKDVRPTRLPTRTLAEVEDSERVEDVYERELSAEMSQSVDGLARSLGVSTNVVYQSAWSVLLARVSNASEVTYGVTTSGRTAPLEDVARRVGPFANALPIRIRIPSDATPLSEWLLSFQDKQLEIQQYEYCSLLDIMGWAGLSAERNLMEAVFSFLNIPISQEVTSGQIGLDVKLRRQGANPLTLIVDFVGVTTLRLHFDERLFDRDTAQRLLNNYVQLLQSFIAHPEWPPARHELLAQEELAQVTTRWTGTDEPRRATTSIHGRIAAAARTKPDADALVLAKQTWSFAKLQATAESVARLLIQQGIGVGDLVLVDAGELGPATAETLATTLGVLCSGAAAIVGDRADGLHVAAIVGSGAEPSDDFNYVDVASVLDHGDEGESVVVDPESRAVVVYDRDVSADGVVFAHEAIVAEHDAEERVLVRDLRSAELLRALATVAAGATVVLDDTSPARSRFRKMVTKLGVTNLELSPLEFNQLMSGGGLGEGSSLAVVGIVGPARDDGLESLLDEIGELQGGETALADVYDAFTQQNGQTGLSYVYRNALSGRSALAGVASSDTMRVAPIDGAAAYVLDKLGRAVAVGRQGELCVTTTATSLGTAARTAAVMLPNPFSGSAGARLVATGDLGRWTASGELEIVARPADRGGDAAVESEAPEHVLPRNATEETIAAIWGKHLNRTELGVHQNFFEAGGHSMMALAIQAELQKEFSLEFSLGELLNRPTIAEIADYILEQSVAGVSDDDLLALLAEVQAET